jgi:hypothetical protein
MSSTDFLKHLKSISKITSEFNLKLHLIKTEFLESTKLFYNTGEFHITPEFLGFLNAEKSKKFVIIDAQNRPIDVDQDFCKMAKKQYDAAVATFQLKYNQLVQEKNNIVNDKYEEAIK